MANRANIVAYRGGLLCVTGWESPIVVDLRGLEIPKAGVPLLQDHRNAVGSVLGRAVVQSDGRCLTAVAHLTKATVAARTVATMLDEGQPLQASIGCDVHDFEHFDFGESVSVNGQTFTADERGLVVARASSLHEISVVPLGADNQTSVALAARLQFKAKEASMQGTEAPTFDEYLESLGFDVASLSDDALAALRSAYEAEYPPEDVSAELSGDEEDEPVSRTAKAHRSAARSRSSRGGQRLVSRSSDAVRIARIKALAAECGEDGEKREEVHAMARTAIVSGVSAAAFKARLFEAFAPKAPAAMSFAAYSGGERPIIEASMAVTCGVPEEAVGKRYGERVMNEAVSKRHRGAGLHAAMRACIRAAGVYSESERIDGHFIKQAFTASRKLEAAGSTMSLPGILGNVANQAMLSAYEAVPTAWGAFSRVGDNKDFRPHERYRLVGKGKFEKVGKSGELEHLQLADQKYTNQLDTTGAIIEITRQHLIDDRVDAFSQIPTMMGRMGAIEVDRAVFQLLMANPNNFFSVARGNYQIGVDRALSLASLALAEQAFDSLEDENGDPAMISPRVLLVPVPLKTVGRSVLNSDRVNQQTEDAMPDGNPFKASFGLVSSPWLTNDKLPGTYKDAKWFLLAGPGDFSVTEVAFLNGQTSPTIESGETDFHTLGVQLRAYFDFGVALLDHRGGVMMVGAAQQ